MSNFKARLDKKKRNFDSYANWFSDRLANKFLFIYLLIKFDDNVIVKLWEKVLLNIIDSKM